MKLFRENNDRILCSMFLVDLNSEMMRLSKQTRAAPFMPVSGREFSICMSHVAATKHVEFNSAYLFFKPSAKASKIRPNSWLTRENAIFLSQASSSFSFSCRCQWKKKTCVLLISIM